VNADDPIATNLRNWESRVPIHAASDTYDLPRFVRDPEHRSTVVRTDLPHLGDLAGLDVLHLQCHIGTDTLSLAREGARVTGLDFSPAALEVARDLAERAGPPVRFVEATVEDAVTALDGERFDLVYTSVGAISWLPSMPDWARTVAALLRPGGRLYLRDGHPFLFTVDETREDDLLVVTHPYGAAHGPQRWEFETTYTGEDTPVAEPVTYDWNHGIGEVVQAVLDAGLTLTELWEGHEVDWPALPGMVERDGRYTLADRPERLPTEFRLQATAPT
jgi:SAM-dependent methyltransferase